MNAPTCKTLRSWLRENLGKNCLAPLCGSETHAMDAISHVTELICCSDYIERPSAVAAFAALVKTLQPKNRYLAYHAIAKSMNWEDRARIWDEAGLEREHGMEVLCNWEPGGAMRRAA